MLERRLEAAVRHYQTAPTWEAWKLVEAACAACLRLYGRPAGLQAVAADLKWRGIKASHH